MNDSIGGNFLSGLSLAERFWTEAGRPAFARECPEVLEVSCAGLVGEGSECLGFDDVISRDHDWGPGFCLWLTGRDMERYGEAAARVYASLPQEYMGFRRLRTNEFSSGRTGVMETGAFYRKYTGLDRAPKSLKEWMFLPENGMVLITDGKVFEDHAGFFTGIRDAYKAYYPEDVRLKKLAGHCAIAAQSGQYNYSRCLKRGERLAAFTAKAQFIDHIQAIMFLINRRFKPYYKWTSRAMRELPVMGREMDERLIRLAGEETGAAQRIEEISEIVIRLLKEESLTSSDSDYLLDHAPLVQARIEDREIRSLHLMVV